MVAEMLRDLQEYYAWGYAEAAEEKRGRFYRFANAHARWLENVPLPAYRGGSLYPASNEYPPNEGKAVQPNNSFTVSVNGKRLEDYPEEVRKAVAEAFPALPNPPAPHCVAGSGYTHSIPYYERICREGFTSYAERIQKIADADMREGLLRLLEGVRVFRERCLAKLKAENAQERLIQALERVPFEPARSLYEALVAWNFVFYLDGCDNPGRVDTGLFPWYRGEDFTAELREFFLYVDEVNAWTMALGPDCNPLTVQALHAIRGIRRPNTELRVTKETPDEVWDAAVENLANSGAQPALYNEEAYQRNLKRVFPQIPAEDLKRFCGGGCTETMLAGISNVGSLDAGPNLPLILTQYMPEGLQKPTFEAFMEGFYAENDRIIGKMCEDVSIYRKARAEMRPQPMRSLLIDDCIDRGMDYNAGGARWMWSVINYAGLVNVIDSLMAIRQLVYTEGMDGGRFLKLLNTEDEDFRWELRRCPCFGVADPDCDRFAHEVSHKLFAMCLEREPLYPEYGLKFLPSSIQFVTFVDTGKRVPATPDGRRAGDPVDDSLAPVHGKDVKGPTAMLTSCAALDMESLVGTPVLNLRMAKEHMGALRGLVMGYFAMGGMQVQVTCTDSAVLREAVAHPEKHGGIVVRVGGYSEYFVRLSPEMQQTIIQRTEHGQ